MVKEKVVEMAQWKIQTGSRSCPHYDGYGGCQNKKVMQRTGQYQPLCRHKYCPIKV